MNSHKIHVLAVAAAMAVFASACSAGTENAVGVATLEADPAASTSDTEAAGVGSEGSDSEDVGADEAALAFSACMRDEGLDFPDIGVDGEGRLQPRDGLAGIDPRSDEFSSAMEACQTLIEDTGFGGGGRAAIGDNVEIQDALVEFSECVRDEGYDVGDLQLGERGQGAGEESAGEDSAAGEGQGGTGAGERQGGFGNRSARFAEQLGLDYDDPDVAAAIDACIPIIDEAFTAAGVGGR